MWEMFLFLLILSAVLEASVKTVERLKVIGVHIVKGGFTQNDMNKLLLIAFSVAICIGFQIPLLDLIALPAMGEVFSFGIIGHILTGLLIARGSNPLHDFIEKVKRWSRETKEE